MESLAWILLVIGAIVGIVAIIAVGIMCWVTAAMYSSNPDLKKDISNWLPVIIPLGIPVGLFFLIYFWIHTAYLSLQAGNFSMTVLIIAIGIIPLFFFGIYYIIGSSKNTAKLEEENKKRQEEDSLSLKHIEK